MTRDECRQAWESSGLTYQEITREMIQKLRAKINSRMRLSTLIKGSFRCHQRTFFTHTREGELWAGVKCRSFYFDDREAVSFNPDGFVGFAGWADETNIQPILEGFLEWINEQAKEVRNDQRRPVN